MLPTIMCKIARLLVMLPRFAWVESRDARHMSRLPFRPSRAGTRMNSSVTCLNTFQCSTRPSMMPAPMVPIPAMKNGIAI
uniref:Putative secreted protein n=1 Tax=Anopheles darlingi TaxID=43151 RepID=A0A2M4DNR8_ANODA